MKDENCEYVRDYYKVPAEIGRKITFKDKPGMQFSNLKVTDTDEFKKCKSSDYNFVFNKKNGCFARWGKDFNDDPTYGPSPEILDLEISTGKCGGKCRFCYKGNGEDINTYHMSLEEFKTIFHKLPNTLGQIAYGICDIESNPDFFAMMKYAREHGVIPNYTCNGLDVTKEIAQKTAKLCGAVAVSLINKEKTYNAINLFVEAGMTQVNCHYVLSQETYDRAFNIIDDIATDPRLKGFNAIVFLQYKHKNLNSPYHSILDVDKYTKLINYCNEKKINYGFDSCSCPMFLKSIKDDPNLKYLETMAEPCESKLFSFYINCHGIGYPCSFAEGIEEGLNIFDCNDFIKDIWNHKISCEWRKTLLDNDRCCPIYDLDVVTNKVLKG